MSQYQQDPVTHHQQLQQCQERFSLHSTQPVHDQSRLNLTTNGIKSYPTQLTFHFRIIKIVTTHRWSPTIPIHPLQRISVVEPVRARVMWGGLVVVLLFWLVIALLLQSLLSDSKPPQTTRHFALLNTVYLWCCYRLNNDAVNLPMQRWPMHHYSETIQQIQLFMLPTTTSTPISPANTTSSITLHHISI